MNVVLIIPTYNERENILVLLDQAISAFSTYPHHNFSYLVVDDTSPDGTGDLVKVYAKQHKNVHLLTGKKDGLGTALLRGMTYATEKLNADILVQIDADLSHDPKVLPKFMKAIDDGADFVVGSRYIPGGSIPQNWGIDRKIYSTVGNGFVRFGLGYSYVHDWTGGFRAFYKKYFEHNKSKMTKFSGYVFQIAFLHNAILEGAKIVEVPIHFADRKYGKSKIATREYIRHIIEYVIGERCKALLSPQFKKFLVVGAIGFIINTVVLEVVVQMVGASPAVGSAVGAELAIISNFFLNNAWTFKERKVTGLKQLLKLLQFNTTSLGAIIIQAGVVWLGTAIYGRAWYHMYYIFGVGLGLIWNYIMYSKVIWKKK
jgi:dolichol-phosphate mannosyltransferase